MTTELDKKAEAWVLDYHDDIEDETTRELVHTCSRVAFKAGVNWLLEEAHKMAYAPDNGMWTEETAFVDQLRNLIETPLPQPPKQEAE